MNKKEFIKKVEAKVPPELEGTLYLQNAIEHITNREGEIFNTNQHQLIIEAIQLANRFKAAHSTKDLDQKNNALIEGSLNVTAQDLLVSDNLIQKIHPWVENLRKEIFESADPPFQHDISGAVKWIEQEEQKDRNAIVSEERNKAIDKIEHLAQKFNIPNKNVNETLPYFDGKSEHIKIARAFPKTKLYKLLSSVKRISKATGFSQASLTMYFLTGLKPIIPRHTVTKKLNLTTLPDGEQIKRTSISIEINVTDLTFDELKTLYDNYRSSLNIKRKTPIGEEQANFYRFVTSKGGPVKGKGSKAFWKQIQQQWNKSNPDNQLSDETVARNKFQRIENKMNL